MSQLLVGQPGRVSWVASLMKQLLEEVRVAPLGITGRARVAAIRDRSVPGVERGIAVDVVDALDAVTLPAGSQEPAVAGLCDDGSTVGRDPRVSRAEMLLRNIETAQLGQQRQQERRQVRRQRRQAEAPVANTRDRLAQLRGLRDRISPAVGEFIKDFRRPEAPPAGSVALDVACDQHGGRLMRLWMSRQAQGVRFGGEGSQDAWATDTRGRGAVVVTCTQPRCRSSARLTNDWLVARLRRVREDFEAGRGLPIAWVPLSRAGAPGR